jgi:hypothetical protein
MARGKITPIIQEKEIRTSKTKATFVDDKRLIILPNIFAIYDKDE